MILLKKNFQCYYKKKLTISDCSNLKKDDTEEALLIKSFTLLINVLFRKKAKLLPKLSTALCNTG